MSNLYLPKTTPPIEEILKDLVRNSFIRKYGDCSVFEYEKPSIVSKDKLKDYENTINKISMNIKYIGTLVKV